MSNSPAVRWSGEESDLWSEGLLPAPQEFNAIAHVIRLSLAADPQQEANLIPDGEPLLSCQDDAGVRPAFPQHGAVQFQVVPDVVAEECSPRAGGVQKLIQVGGACAASGDGGQHVHSSGFQRTDESTAGGVLVEVDS